MDTRLSRQSRVIVALAMLCAGCSSSTPEVSSSRASPSVPPSDVSSPSSREEPRVPTFSARIEVIDAAARARIESSWRPGCPVPLRDLRLIEMTFWGFDARQHTGELVVHESAASDVVGVFRKLFAARFPIRRMRLVDVYDGDDERSMAANNTSGFNCRRSTSDASRWSRHAYGMAIDVDPVQNPYVDGDKVLPPAGRAYLDRSDHEEGMIRDGDVVVRAFAAIGWRWGGDFRSFKDYQHFDDGRS